MSSLETTSSPETESRSPGSSVSTRLQEEYDELLRYAVVTPQVDPRSFPPDKMRRSPLAQAGVMTRERDVLSGERQEDTTETEPEETGGLCYDTWRTTCSDVMLPFWYLGESSQLENGSEESGAHLAVSPPENEPMQIRREVGFATSGTPHRVGHVVVPPLVVDDNSPGSIAGDDGMEGREPAVDQDMMRLELQLDAWTLDLKRNILVGDTCSS